MPLIIISLMIQLALVVHIIRTGRSTTWIFLVLFFPLIGTLAYLIVELLPELLGTRTARKIKRDVSAVIHPDRELKAASERLAVAGTVENALTLAEQCLEKSMYGEAKTLYQRCLSGVHADDPHIMLGLARAQFGLGEFADVINTLDRLKEKNPDFRSADGHLLYARAQEGLGNVAAAMHEYDVLVSYYPGPEPACRLALLHKAQGDMAQAAGLFQKVLNESRLAGRHYHEMHKDWVALARREVAEVCVGAE